MNAGYNRGGFNQPMATGFQGSGMGGFPNGTMGNMSSYGGFQNRGGMGGMRGGANGMRGGRGGMMGMPMSGMNFGAMGMGIGMGMGMNMPQMGANMGMQGMPGSHNYPVAHPAGYRGSSVTLTAPPSSALRDRTPFPSPPPIGIQTGLPGSSPLPNLRVGRAPSSWASYTQYSSPSVGNISATHLSSPAHSSRTASFTDANAVLKPRRSPTGQMGNQTHFNPAMFNHQQQGTGDNSWNPHGAKRTRQE